jgi:hypothetical protein
MKGMNYMTIRLSHSIYSISYAKTHLFDHGLSTRRLTRDCIQILA